MTSRTTRRGLLSLISVGSATLAGCGAISSKPEGVVLAHISFKNYTSKEQTLQYQVKSGDQILVDQTTTLKQHKEADDYHQDRQRFVYQKLHEQATYTIRYRLHSSDEWEQSYTFNGDEYTCLGVIVNIREGGISLYTGEIPDNQCPRG